MDQKIKDDYNCALILKISSHRPGFLNFEDLIADEFKDLVLIFEELEDRFVCRRPPTINHR